MFLPLRAETRETFLLPADYLIQQPRGGTLGLPCGVGVNVHRGTDVGMAQQLLHVLGCRTVGEQIAGERVSKHMEVKVLQPRNFLLRLTAHDTHRPRRFNGSVRPETDKGQFPIPLRHLHRPRQGVDLVIGPVFLPDLRIVVQAVKLPIAQAVPDLLPLGRFEDLPACRRSPRCGLSCVW